MSNTENTFVKVASIIAIIIGFIVTCYTIYFFGYICFRERRRNLIINPILPG